MWSAKCRPFVQTPIYPTNPNLSHTLYQYLSMPGIKLIRVSKKSHDLRMGIESDYCVCGEISNTYLDCLHYTT